MCKSECKGFKSVLLKSVSYTDWSLRDVLVNISMQCSETDFSNFISTLDDLISLFRTMTPEVKGLLEEATSRTSYCKAIGALSLPFPPKEVVVPRNTSVVSAKEL